jgi:hydrogenase nickel incorporation protein HypB
MCATCGCSDDNAVRLIDLQAHGQRDAHTHPDGTTHSHGAAPTHGGGHTHGAGHTDPRPPAETETLTLEARVLAKNDELAAHNRGWLDTRGAVAVNLMSSPGSGKTTLLENSVRLLAERIPVCVIEGDQETTFDADRILATGARVVQVNTGSGCHLDADMLRVALNTLNPAGGVVLIENVGNLVCPALFDLGEAARVVIMSVTEGADKPLKYPQIFRSASVVVLNKVDLLPYVEFDVERFVHDVGLLNPAATILQVSATRGDGLRAWLDWVSALVPVGTGHRSH